MNESAESPEGDGNYKKESDRNDKWKHNSKTEKFRLNNRKLKKSLLGWKTETLKPWQLKNLRETLKLITRIEFKSAKERWEQKGFF